MFSQFGVRSVNSTQVHRHILANARLILKKDFVEKNAKSREHEIAVSAKRAKETDMPVSIIQGMGKDVLDRMEKVFNTRYYISKQELQFTLFPSMIELQCKNGLSMGSSYINDKACSMFLSHIYHIMLEDLITLLKSCNISRLILKNVRDSFNFLFYFVTGDVVTESHEILKLWPR